jgi:3-oxoacyl-(acyl-carrier-protein) synthase
VSNRAVITGVGVIAPTGIGNDKHWQSTLQGRNAVRRITRFDPSSYATQLAGEVEGFEARDFIEQRMVVQTDRWTWMALAAAQLSFADAGFDPSSTPPYDMCVITASSSGGNEFGQKEIQNLWGKGANYVSAYQSIAWFYAATTGQISIKHGIKGPSSVLVSEGAGGLDTLGHARRVIRRGVKAVVAGGTEAPISPYALTCQMANGRLSRSADPVAAYRPFDAAANGYVPGEGGAILLVEELSAAQHRGAANIYAEIAGYAATNDAYNHARVEPDGRHLTRAIALAIADAGLTPADIDAVFADGAGVAELDHIEARALQSALGAETKRIPVTVPKSMTGRLYAGGASLDVATAVMAMREGTVPPTINCDQPAEGCELRIVTGRALTAPLRNVLLVARGFGGFNSAVVLRRFQG